MLFHSKIHIMKAIWLPLYSPVRNK